MVDVATYLFSRRTACEAKSKSDLNRARRSRVGMMRLGNRYDIMYNGLRLNVSS